MAFAEQPKLSLEDYLPSGKYGPNGKQGHSKLRVVIMADAKYVDWAARISKPAQFFINEAAEKLLTDQLEKQE